MSTAATEQRTPILAARGLYKSYGNVTAMEGADFELYPGENLEAITAVVLGGTSLFGGRGTVIGTLIGAMIVGVLRNGLVLMGVASIYQVLITGILVILAVSVDQLARRGAK
jgi:ribose/xylose/arabinose/galactoside ABC-type transport system permease subunit